MQGYTKFKLLFIPLPQNLKHMAEETKSKHGGKRIGAGRPPSPNSKKQIALKLDNELFKAFNSPPFTKDGEGFNRGRYINEAIREKMERDGYIHVQTT